tara:strand:- start:6043 stop:6753 length:711 start_codon:yes stop_codon:yes gene_type:complete
MNNLKTGDFYFGISDDKVYICFFEKGENKYKQEVNFKIPDTLNNNLNFKIILNLLKKNIRRIEKNLGLFLNSGNISIQSNTYQSIIFSIKNIFDEKILNKKDITDIIQTGIHEIQNNEKNIFIVHIIINKYVIDDTVYKFYPNDLKFKKIILEMEFICLDKNLIDKVKNLFSECKIQINKIVSYEYAKKFLTNDEDDTMCVSANKVLNGVNQSEVYLVESSPEKPSLFNIIFNFFN